jgi:hypothetical protein
MYDPSLTRCMCKGGTVPLLVFVTAHQFSNCHSFSALSHRSFSWQASIIRSSSTGAPSKARRPSTSISSNRQPGSSAPVNYGGTLVYTPHPMQRRPSLQPPPRPMTPMIERRSQSSPNVLSHPSCHNYNFSAEVEDLLTLEELDAQTTLDESDGLPTGATTPRESEAATASHSSEAPIDYEMVLTPEMKTGYENRRDAVASHEKYSDLSTRNLYGIAFRHTPPRTSIEAIRQRLTNLGTLGTANIPARISQLPRESSFRLRCGDVLIAEVDPNGFTRCLRPVSHLSGTKPRRRSKLSRHLHATAVVRVHQPPGRPRPCVQMGVSGVGLAAFKI